jgi:hypothetical protein
VLRRDPFVPEVAVDLEHFLDAADGEALQVELRRDAHEQPHVERVVMRREGPCQRPAGNRLHHRRLDLEKAAPDEELPKRADHTAANFEHLARIRIDDEVQIALPVADFDVLQAMPLLGQRQQTLGEELQLRRPDRQLVGPRAKQAPLDANPVAEIEQLEDLEVALGQRVLTDVHLHARAAV